MNLPHSPSIGYHSKHIFAHPCSFGINSRVSDFLTKSDLHPCFIDEYGKVKLQFVLSIYIRTINEQSALLQEIAQTQPEGPTDKALIYPIAGTKLGQRWECTHLDLSWSVLHSPVGNPVHGVWPLFHICI